AFRAHRKFDMRFRRHHLFELEQPGRYDDISEHGASDETKRRRNDEWRSVALLVPVEGRLNESPDLPKDNWRCDEDARGESDLEVDREDLGCINRKQRDSRTRDGAFQESNDLGGVHEAKDRARCKRDQAFDQPASKLLEVVQERHLAEHGRADKQRIDDHLCRMTRTITPWSPR